MGFVKTIFKKVITWGLRFIKNRIILAIIGVILGFLVVGLQTAIADILSRTNNILVSNLYKIENFLFELQNKIYDAAASALNWLDSQVHALMDNLLPETFVNILSLINFAQWIQLLFSDLINQVGTKLEAVAASITTPFLDQLNAIDSRVTGAITAMTNAQTNLNDALANFHTSLTSGLQNQIDNYNNRVNTLASQLDGLEAWYNADFEHLQRQFEIILGQIIAYNMDLAAKQTQIQQYILSNLPTGSPITATQRDQLIAGAIAQAQTFFVDINAFSIDWSQYNYSLDTGFYPLSLSLPDLEWTFEIDASAVMVLATDAANIKAWLNALPGEIETGFKTEIPAIVIAVFEIQIRQKIALAIQETLNHHKSQLNAKIADMRNQIEIYGKESAAVIQAKVEEIKTAILDAQLALIEELPAILEPTIIKFMNKTKDKLNEIKDKAIEDADKLIDFQPDFSGIQDIFDRFPASILPKEDSNIRDAKDWTLQDVYRVLCNNFYRKERLALIARLAMDDINIELSVLTDLISKLGD